MRSFLDQYDNVLGHDLEGVAFMPLSNTDTPGVVAELRKPAFWFSGAVCLGFAGMPELFLTWVTKGDEQALGITSKPLWNRFSLDRITVSPEEPWSALNRATLKGIRFFSHDSVSEGKVVAIRHEFENRGAAVRFLVATGFGNAIGEGDDLFVGLDVSESNLALREVKSLYL